MLYFGIGTIYLQKLICKTRNSDNWLSLLVLPEAKRVHFRTHFRTALFLVGVSLVVFWG